MQPLFGFHVFSITFVPEFRNAMKKLSTYKKSYYKTLTSQGDRM